MSDSTNTDAIEAECAQQLLAIYAKRRELNDEAGEIRARLKDIGINTQGFEAGLKNAHKENEARDHYMDAFRRGFQTAETGDTLDWIAAVEKADAAAA